MSENTQIYSATYSNVPVFEYVTSEGPIMRRKGDSWINATHILKIAKLPKAKRTRILEKDVQTGIHEKVQGGYGKYQGTYVPLKLGEVIAQNYGVYDTLKPIFDFEYIEGKTETPPPAPKHNHASALNIAKRQASLQKKDAQQKQPKPQKAKKVGDDEPRKRGRPKGSTLSSTPSLQHSDTVPLGSTVGGYSRDSSFAAPIPRMSRQNTEQDALQMMASNMNLRREDLASVDTDEDDDDSSAKNGGASLKRSKKNNGVSMTNGDFDTNADLLTSRELFGVSRNTFEKNAHNFNGPQADLITPYHQPSINLPQENQIYSDYFSNFVAFFLDDEGHKGQWNALPENVLPEKLLNPPHPVSKIHINHPIDNEGNTIFHWLCSLGYLTLIKFLIDKFGKEIRLDIRNNNGETPLMFMVKFSNCFSSNTFEEVLSVLFESLILVDSSGKTVLHHIVEYKKEKVAAYYLEILLKHLVSGGDGSSEDKENTSDEKFELITKFINHQDSDGNTAFHIAAYNLSKKLIRVFIDYHKFINFSLRNLVTCTVEDYLASHNYVLRLDAATDGEENSNSENTQLINNPRHDMIEEADSLGQSFDAQLYNSKLAINLYNNTANILTEKMAELSYIINQELKEKDDVVLGYFKTLAKVNEIKLSTQRSILSMFKLEHLIDDLDESPQKEKLDPSSQESNVLETNYDNYQVNFKRDQIIQEEIQRLVNDSTYQLLHKQDDLSRALQKFKTAKEYGIKKQLEAASPQEDGDADDADDADGDRFELANLLQIEILKKRHLLNSVVDYSKDVPLLPNDADTSKPITEQYASDPDNKLIKYCKLISLSCGMRFDEIESNIDSIEQSLLKNR
ncbi:MBP1 [Candida theae]|uniref:Transcription factor MBP1 n=1 Tax=Candida theae TaxID=1198502 RepID=A0AAD5BEU1_9ASCO|nr:MBP1 [Candida theae]KAI5958369.1 MBP1 [Candida theae]